MQKGLKKIVSCISSLIYLSMWRGVSESVLGEDLFINEKVKERWEAQTLAERGASGSGSC